VGYLDLVLINFKMFATALITAVLALPPIAGCFTQTSNSLDIDGIIWTDHGKIDLDAWAHYFKTKDGQEFALLFEDFPGNTFLDDGLTHEIVKIDGQNSISIAFKDDKYMPNITGYFTLYREKSIL
jgi:hypothetical protein